MDQRKGFLRNSIFGAEDSLVSTVGLLSGITFAGLDSREIIISGIILIIVEATSMAAGTYISEDSANDLELANGKKENQLYDAVVMFFSYLLVGLIPLSPYLFTPNTHMAFYWSIVATIVALFFLGVFRGYYVGHSIWKSAIKIMLIGSITAGLGITVGLLLKF